MYSMLVTLPRLIKCRIRQGYVCAAPSPRLGYPLAIINIHIYYIQRVYKVFVKINVRGHQIGKQVPHIRLEGNLLLDCLL
jgi:hypothetical protein